MWICFLRKSTENFMRTNKKALQTDKSFTVCSALLFAMSGDFSFFKFLMENIKESSKISRKTKKNIVEKVKENIEKKKEE